MANYTKSFNFKNGVQVDTDNFIIDSNGLVGVGTTNPGKLLDVYGSARFSGVTSLTDANISGIVTVGSAILIDAASGVITATKFVGSAGDLTGVVAIATDGWVQNAGSLSTTAKIGIGSENEAAFQSGTGIEIYHLTNPRIKLINNATGVGTEHGTQLYLNNNGEFIIDNKETSDIRFSTSETERVRFTNTGRVGIGSTIPTSTLDVAGDLTVSNNSTFGNYVGLSSGLTVAGVSTLGVSTFIGDVSFGSSIELGDNLYAKFGDNEDLKIYHTTASGGYSVISEAGTGQLIIGSNIIEFKNEALNSTQALFYAGDRVELNYNNTKRFSTSGVGVTVYDQLDTTNAHISGISTLVQLDSSYTDIGIATISNHMHVGTGGTAFSITNAAKVGIGTSDPTADFTIRQINSTSLEVISDSSSSKISIGQSVGAGNSSAVLTWNDKTFDIRNNDLGDFSMYLHKGGAAGINTGSFKWIYGQDNSTLMSLTHDGKLGIGSHNPHEQLYVKGDSIITGDLKVDGTINYGTFTLPDPIESKIYATSGVSTFSTIHVLGGDTNRIGIGTTIPRVGLDAEKESAIFNKVGIGTTNPHTSNALEVVGTLRATNITATNDLYATGLTGTPSITVYDAIVNNNLTVSGTANINGVFSGDGQGLEKIPTGYANVMDYGAIADGLVGMGASENTFAFQSALDSGKPVFVPPGTYRVDGPLDIPSDSGLVGLEERPILVKMSGIGTPIISVGVGTTGYNTNNNAVIENIILQNKIGGDYAVGLGSTNPGVHQAGVAVTGIGSTFSSIQNLVLKNIDVDNFPTGFYFSSVLGVKVYQCKTYVQNYNDTVGDNEKYSIGYHFDATRFNDDVGMVSPCGIELFDCEDNRNGTPGTALTATSSTGIGTTATNSISYYVKGNDIRDVSFTNCKSKSAQRGWYVEGTGTDLDWNIHLTKPNVDKFKKNGAEFKNVNGVGAVSINDGYFNGSNYSEKSIFADTCKGLIVGGGTQIVGVSTNNSTGVYLNSSESCSINANRFSNLLNPIYLEASNYNTIDGNVIGASESPGTVGIGTSLADGIILNGNSDRNTISGNVIKGLGPMIKYYNGIIIGASADKNSLMGNIVDVDTVTNPIVISGTGNTSLGNIIV
jgi:hypothetical protein